MPTVLVAVGLGAVTGGLGAYIAGTAILTGALIGGGLAALQTLLAPKLDDLPSADTRQTVVAGVEAARWIVGRARTGGSLKFYEEVADGAEVWLVYALSEGACDAIERVWIDSDLVELERTGTRLRPMAASDYRDKIVIYEYFAADGTQGAEIAAACTEWTAQHRMVGVSWVAVHLVQPDYGNDADDRFWARSPQLQFLVRGLKLTWPGQAIPTWTESAAAIRYWFERERGGLPVSAFDEASVRAAHMLCSQDVTVALPADLADYTATAPRYSANGIVTADMSATDVRTELDFAWQGWAAEKAGVVYFRPGADRAVAWQLGPDDILSVDGIRPALAIQDRVNAITMTLPASADHEYLEYDVPEVVDDDVLERDDHHYLPRDLGRRLFVAYPVAAQRLTGILLRRGRASMTATIRITPGPLLERFGMVPSDWLSITLPEYGFADFVFLIRSAQVNPDLSMTLVLAEQRTGDYADTLDLPPYRPRDIAIPGPRVVSDVAGLTLDEIAVQQLDGSVLVALVATYDPRPVRRTELEMRVEGQTQVRSVSSHGARAQFDAVQAGQTVEVRARHVSSADIPGPWSAYVSRLVGGDLVAPDAAAGLALTTLAGGYRVDWSEAAARDYDHSEIWQSLGSDAFAAANLIARVSATTFERFGFDAEAEVHVWVRHVDRSGNQAMPTRITGNAGAPPILDIDDEDLTTAVNDALEANPAYQALGGEIMRAEDAADAAAASALGASGSASSSSAAARRAETDADAAAASAVTAGSRATSASGSAAAAAGSAMTASDRATAADGSATAAASSATAVVADANAAAGSATAAATSAMAAAASATDAGTEATAATAARVLAETAQAAAGTSAMNAAASETAADGSATAAASSATAVVADANAAAGSATAAATSAMAAAASATDAGTEATAATAARVLAETAQAAAGTSAMNAAASETAADGSATAAASSATAVVADANAAAGSATAAATSAMAAAASATDAGTEATSAAVSRVDAATQATVASASAVAAASSRQDAESSAAAALVSQTAAAASADGAEAAIAGIEATVTAEVDDHLGTTLAAAVVLRAEAGSADARLELVALSDLEGVRSAARIRADQFLIGDQFEVDAATGRLRLTRLDAEVIETGLLSADRIDGAVFTVDGFTLSTTTTVGGDGAWAVQTVSGNDRTGAALDLRNYDYLLCNVSQGARRQGLMIPALESPSGRTVYGQAYLQSEGGTSRTDPGWMDAVVDDATHLALRTTPGRNFGNFDLLRLIGVKAPGAPVQQGTTTDTDHVYRLGTVTPATPSGGMNVENHQPAGWLRAAPSPTLTQNSYVSVRTRTFSNGVFQSATAWEAPDLHEAMLPPGLTLANPGNRTATRNVAFSLRLGAASGGTAPYVYTVVESIAGISFNASTRRLSGTPTSAAGSYTIVYIVTDADDETVSVSFSITLAEANQSPVANAGPNQTVSERDVVTLDGSGSSDPDGSIASYAWAQIGSDPAVVLDDATAAQPQFTAPAVTSATNVTLELTVTDDDGDTDSDRVLIGIGNNPPNLPVSYHLPDATVGVAYSHTLPAAIGGNAPLTYSVTGSVGDGMAFNAGTRVISGTPTTSGSNTFSLLVSDADGDTDSAENFVLTVLPSPTLSDAVRNLNIHFISSASAAWMFDVPMSFGNGTFVRYEERIRIVSATDSTNILGEINWRSLGSATLGAVAAAGIDNYATGNRLIVAVRVVTTHGNSAFRFDTELIPA